MRKRPKRMAHTGSAMELAQAANGMAKTAARRAEWAEAPARKYRRLAATMGLMQPYARAAAITTDTHLGSKAKDMQKAAAGRVAKRRAKQIFLKSAKANPPVQPLT